MPSVLFVCTANQFRSPLAAAIFRKALASEGQQRRSPWHIGPIEDWTVDSAGTWARQGEPVLRDVLEAGAQLGVDLSGHRSELVSEELLSGYDLILVMQTIHLELLGREYSHLNERIYLLSLVIDYGSYDFQDTHRFLQEVMQVGGKLDELIQRNMHYICVLATAIHNKRKRTAQPGQEEIEMVAKKPYVSPQLTEYGDVEKLTRGGQGSGTDGGSAGMSMTCL